MLQAGEVCVLENLRFHPEEEKNDLDFCKQLAQLADIYVDDAFGTSHRAHASTQGITKFVRPALAGFLLDRELEMLSGALNHPVRPFATIIGGAKVSSKIGVLEHLLGCADLLIIGGAMAFTFLKARGLETGKSLVEHDQIEYCRQLESQAAAKGVRLILPVDLVCAKEIKPGAVTQIFACDQIPADQMGLDVGPETREAIATALSACKTILWNGPLGVFEIAEFAAGTFALIDQLVKLTGQGVTTVIGGGDSVAALKERGVGDLALTHVSTGGGASLEFLEGRTLPGVSCLDDLAAVAAPASI
jgi:phosphoglycerate kinase